MTMRTLYASFAAGALFGAGLAISQMVNPQKVTDFLDFFGRWDPSLALVMGGALAVTALSFRVILRRPRPLLDRDFHLPAASDVDHRLLGGAALFGVGWGLAGFCPGPAVASLAYGLPASVLFVAAMIAGMALGDRALPRYRVSSAGYRERTSGVLSGNR
jgi:uncharacterized protein